MIFQQLLHAHECFVRRGTFFEFLRSDVFLYECPIDGIQQASQVQTQTQAVASCTVTSRLDQISRGTLLEKTGMQRHRANKKMLPKMGSTVSMASNSRHTLTLTLISHLPLTDHVPGHFPSRVHSRLCTGLTRSGSTRTHYSYGKCDGRTFRTR